MTEMPRRTERFGLVFSPPERAGLRYLAEQEGLAEADVLRQLLRLTINGLPEEVKQAIGWTALPGSHNLTGGSLSINSNSQLPFSFRPASSRAPVR